jgi:hypothetical protein
VKQVITASALLFSKTAGIEFPKHSFSQSRPGPGDGAFERLSVRIE